jgi:hypothetical protein
MSFWRGELLKVIAQIKDIDSRLVNKTGDTMTGALRVQGTPATIPASNVLTISMSDDSAVATDFRMEKVTASPAANDVVARIISQANNSVGTIVAYSVQRTLIEDPTSGSEDSSWDLFTYVAGASARRVRVRNGMDLNGTADPGAGSLSLTNLVASARISRDSNYYIDFTGSDPLLNMDANDYYTYNRSGNKHSFYVGSAERANIDTNGLNGVIGATTASAGTFTTVSMNNILTNSLNPNTGPSINTAGNAQAIGSGAEVALSNHSGLLVIVDHTNGATGVYAVGGGTVTFVGGAAQYIVGSAPSTSQVGVYYSAPTYRVKNGFAASHTFGMLWLSARNSV